MVISPTNECSVYLLFSSSISTSVEETKKASTSGRYIRMGARGFRIFCTCNFLCLPPLALACLGGGAKKDSFPYKIHVFLSRTIWVKLLKFTEMILGKRVTKIFRRISHYITKERNPLVQIFFWICFLMHLFFMIPTLYLPWEAPQLSKQGVLTRLKMPPLIGGENSKFGHLPFTPITIIGQIIVATTFILACRMDPGTQTPMNSEEKPEKGKESVSESNKAQKHEDEYPPSAIWPKERVCKTCGITRSPRMHHCRVCNRCVAGFDHHCIWINSDVGQGNILMFHAFLLLTGIGLFYIGVLSYSASELMLNEVGVIELMTQKQVGFFQRARFYFRCMMIISPFALCSLVFHMFLGLVLVLFWLVQAPHVVFNKLTYETFRWIDLQDAIEIVSNNPDDKEMKKVLADHLSWALQGEFFGKSDRLFLEDIKGRLSEHAQNVLDTDVVRDKSKDKDDEKPCEIKASCFSPPEQRRLESIILRNPYNRGVIRNTLAAIKHITFAKSRCPNGLPELPEEFRKE